MNAKVKKPLTADEQQRKAEFDRIYNAIPARANIERIRYVCGILYCRENTVRIWRMRHPPRIIPVSSLKILRAALEREGVLKPETAKAGANE